MKNRNRWGLLTVAAMSLALGGGAAFAQGGQISVTVDATQTPQKIVKTRESIPAKAGPMSLYYPKWIPGEHGPDGPIGNVTGLKFTANGKVIAWQRDLLDLFTFHIDVPAGADHVDVAFDYIEPSSGGFATSATSATDKLLVIEWNQNVLYPAGVNANQIIFKPSLIVPDGWKFGTSQHVEKQLGNEISFSPLTLEKLVDSPVIIGQYYKSYDLTPPGEPVHHEIDIVADSEIALNMSADIQKKMTNLVAEAGKLFGARHYREYKFLLTLSDHVAHFGLEHHECNDSRLPERVLLSPGAGLSLGGLLAHEYAHSWSGKYRRPAGLATPEYETPMKTDMLWDYEGMTEFAGPLLAARSGLWTPEQYRDNLANISTDLGPGRPGRTWRSLLDTAAAQGLRGGGWGNWRRGSDYYDEGDLMWLEVATIIYQQSHGEKTMDDFLHTFYGGANNGVEVKPYTFEDVVHDLNATAPYDWATFLHDRLNSNSPNAPTGGIENGGWKSVLTSDLPERERRRGGGVGDEYSIGLQVGDDGSVRDSIVGGPAFKAGITSGMKIVGVNGRVFAHDYLEDAIDAAKDNTKPIELLVVIDEYYKICNVDYHGGQKHPHLIRDESKPDYIDELVKPKAGM